LESVGNRLPGQSRERFVGRGTTVSLAPKRKRPLAQNRTNGLHSPIKYLIKKKVKLCFSKAKFVIGYSVTVKNKEAL
jgi:hypothetical protein